MKVVFLAGPYRSETVNGIWENVQKARAVSVEVWQMGAVALCPHLNTAMMDGACPDEVWLSGAQELLRRCDAAVLLPGWKMSEGSKAEWEMAERLDIPHFRWTVDRDLFSEWLRSEG